MTLRLDVHASARPRLLAAVLAACLLLAGGLVSAQVPPSLSGPIESQRASIESGDLEDPQRSLAIEQLDAAASADAAAETLLEQIQAMRSDAASASARTQELSQSLAVDREQAQAQWLQRLPEDVSTELLERLLDQERSVIAGLRADLDRAGADLAQALSSGAHPDTSDSELRTRAERLAAPLVPGEAEPAALTRSRQLRRDAELRQARAELELREVAQDGLMERQRDLELTLRELRHRLAIHEPRLLALQQRIAEVGRQELELLVADLEAMAQPAAGASHAVVTAAERNRELTQALLQDNERLAEERAQLEDQERARDRSAAVLRDSRVRLELGGSSEEVGRWLWRERRALEPRARIAQRLAQLRNTLGRQRLRLVNLSEELRDLSELPQAVRDLRSGGTDGADDEDDAARGEHAALTVLLEQRRSLLERQEPLLRRRIAALEQTELAVQGHLDASTELQQILDRYLLWIPSHEPIGLAWLARVPTGLADLVKPSRLVTSARLLGEAAQARPWLHLGAALLVALLVVAARLAGKRIPPLAQAVRRVRTDRFVYTLQALALTALAALPWAAAALALGLLLQQVGVGGKYSDSLGRALVSLVLPLLTVAFIRVASIEQGLGHAHFRWTRQRRETVQRLLPPLAAVLIPAYFIVSLAFLRNQDLATDVQARLALLLLCLVGAWACAWMLAPGRLWTARGVMLEPSPLRRALRVALPAFLVVCAGLALAGYVYSAAIVVRALLASVGVVMAVATVHGLLARWFLLGERQLALRRLDQRRADQARDGGAGGSSGSDVESGEAGPDLADEITLEMVNAQSRRLLRALRLTLLVIGVAAVWAEVLPAFSRLDEVGLWQTSEAGPDGATVAVPVTLMAVLLGLAVLALTVIAARNLPGLIEIGLMSRAGVDAASRYAITSVARYAIVIAGVLIGVGLLGLRWGQLQWMAAALTVGLGFGLQEIFANFVSGLILLFERPFRVGDVITVGELSGTVTRIRTRATTILDFDNMEIVVPNKTFITGQLINWTLTDTTTRITIKVGVAYHTDPARVHALLMQAAQENPRVLADPAPRSWFLAFGGSSLDFELRVFVGALGDRLAVQNELNGRIAELMAQQEIEIAFPQLDLHVRDLPPLPERPDGAGRGDDRTAQQQPKADA